MTNMINIKDSMFYKKCSTCTNHKECINLAKIGMSRSAIAAIISNNNDKISLNVGLENDGDYKDTYNMCAGKGDNKDINTNGFCWINNLLRELEEEFKIKLSYDEYKKYFRINNRAKIILIGRSPCFVGFINVDLNKINNKVNEDMNDTNKPSYYKEMRHIKNVPIDDYKNQNISILTREVIYKLNKKPTIYYITTGFRTLIT